jgi:uncharacterized protein
MDRSFARFVESIPVVDVHEHHTPREVPGQSIGLLQILEESYAGWTQVLPYPLPGWPPVPPATEPDAPVAWADIARYVEGSGTNAAVRGLVRAVCRLCGVRGGEITQDNWKSLDAEIRGRNADPSWSDSVMDRARIQTAISDPYADPLLDVRKALGDRYRSVLRINAFAFGWHPESSDHNGVSGHALMRRLGISPSSFDEYVEGLGLVLDRMSSLSKVGLKNALAYERPVDFDPPDEAAARAAWGKQNPAAHERKAFGDFVVDRLCRLAGERDIPFQMHLGTALIRGSRPLAAAGLVERHPQTRFLLMHLAWPWTGELLGMAFVYRNIWLDLTWSWILSPSRFVGAFKEAVDVLPDESRMMLGGDSWHAEESFGALGDARKLIAGVLDGMVREGQFPRRAAERLAVKIFHDNGKAFFRL